MGMGSPSSYCLGKENKTFLAGLHSHIPEWTCGDEHRAIGMPVYFWDLSQMLTLWKEIQTYQGPLDL